MTVIALPTLAIRRLATADIAAASQLLHKVWHETYRAQLPAELRKQRTEDYFADYLAARTDRAWTAWMGKRIAGLATLSSNSVDDLWVARRHRRRGIATRLVDQATRHLADRGFTHIQAGCEDFNQDATAFFDALGWQRIGNEPLYLVPGRPINAIVFSRRMQRAAVAERE